MPMLAGRRRFLNVEEGYLLKAAIEMTCRALRVEKHDPARSEIIVRAAELARSGLNSADAIRDRIVYEAKVLSEIGAEANSRDMPPSVSAADR